MALTVVDASVVIAQLDPRDALHERASSALEGVAGDDLIFPASALAETLVFPARSGRVREARERIEMLLLRIEPLTDVQAEVAARLRAGHPNLRLPDAFVLATAETLDADVILTADKKWTRWSSRVRLV